MPLFLVESSFKFIYCGGGGICPWQVCGGQGTTGSSQLLAATVVVGWDSWLTGLAPLPTDPSQQPPMLHPPQPRRQSYF